MNASNLSLVSEHVVILGYSDFTEALLEELESRTELVVVTEESSVVSDLEGREINTLHGDPTDSRVLSRAGADVASGVVTATKDDAQDVLAVLAAKEVNPDVRIVAAANDHHNVSKLEAVGADVVISPTELGGQFLARAMVEDADSVLGTAETDDE